MHTLDPRLRKCILLGEVLLTRAIRYRNLLRIVRKLRIVQHVRIITFTLPQLGARCKSSMSGELTRPLTIKEARASLLIKSRATSILKLHSLTAFITYIFIRINWKVLMLILLMIAYCMLHVLNLLLFMIWLNLAA